METLLFLVRKQFVALVGELKGISNHQISNNLTKLTF